MSCKLFIKYVGALLCAGFAVLSAPAQGTFQNLDFEAAAPVPVPGGLPGTVALASAFPGWAATVNGRGETSALHENLSITPALALFGPASSVPQGSYAAVFQAAALFLPSEIALFQSGQVPADAASIRFVGSAPSGLAAGQVSLWLGGTPLPLAVLEERGPLAWYGADVSAHSGQTAELRFLHTVGAGGSGLFTLDAIEFSPTPVPEPATWSLLLAGGALARLLRRRR